MYLKQEAPAPVVATTTTIDNEPAPVPAPAPAPIPARAPEPTPVPEPQPIVATPTPVEPPLHRQARQPQPKRQHLRRPRRLWPQWNPTPRRHRALYHMKAWSVMLAALSRRRHTNCMTPARTKPLIISIRRLAISTWANMSMRVLWSPVKRHWMRVGRTLPFSPLNSITGNRNQCRPPNHLSQPKTGAKSLMAAPSPRKSSVNWRNASRN